MRLNEEYFNFVCGYNKDKEEIVDCTITLDTDVEVPKWCKLIYPKNNENNGVTTQEVKPSENKAQKILTEREKWNAIIPKIKWEDIKIHGIYHVPPYLGKKRADIKIVYKNDDFFTYNVLGNKVYTVDYAYRADLIWKLMVEPKTITYQEKKP